MAKRFHDREFDDATQLKLAIFRKYIREWVPVFLTAPQHGRGPNYPTVNIFDFFAGPGTDNKRNRGSPLIIQDELRAYCESHSGRNTNDLTVNLYFNDKDEDNIKRLRLCLLENKCPLACCTSHFQSMPFAEAFEKYLPAIQDRQSANLVIMDQCGIKEVTPKRVNILARCKATDILFFVSSSFLRRFPDDPSFQRFIRVNTGELSTSPYKWIHRLICQYYRSEMPPGTSYHLAPFSLKKPEGNIYGVIFGSGLLLGLEKFLKVCWDLDRATGEANYDIDEDRIDPRQKALFAEMDVPKKLDGFNRDLEEGLLTRVLHSNKDVYRFALEKGCLPKHASEHLRKLQDSGRLEVIETATKKPSRRKGTFYLTWKAYSKDHEPRVGFRLKE